MPASIGVAQDGAVVEYTDTGSAIRWSEGGTGDTPASVLVRVIARLRHENDKARDPARERSLAITNAEQALHWLRALDERRST